ncbi:WD40 repeat domain-containing protein [Plantactinospora sp. GCM10030261]|uniref:WD40 repeat domain-containing protein n=1 Tax=Plantactinospora sp. GCM10030261 TaxID=3273420 RepID=UPI0036200E61
MFAWRCGVTSRVRRVRGVRRAAVLVPSLSIFAILLAAPAGAVLVPPPEVGTLASTNPSNITPHARNGEARAFAEIGDTVYVGGTFTQVRTAADATLVTRNYLFAYDRDTGALRAFAPALNGAVNALATSPDGKLIVGGAFNTVNGVSRRNLVELDPVTGAIVDSWEGRSDGGNVRALKVHGNQLYVGGAFNWLNGVQRNGLARLNATTGELDPAFVINATVGRHNTSSYVWTLDVSADGGTLVVGGNFTLLNGLGRNQVGLVDLAGTPTVADWSTHRYVPPCASPNTFVHYAQEVEFSDDGSYFVIVSNGGGGWPTAYCDALVRYETATRGSNLDATWIDWTGNDSITSVEVTDNVIYLGGHFRWLNNPNASDRDGPGAVDRLGIAAADPSNGMPLNWNPRRSGAPAGYTAWGSTVPVLWRGSTGVYFGHNSDGMGGEYHGRLGMFPMAGGRTVPALDAAKATPGYLYLGTGPNQLTKVPFAGGTLGAATVTSQPNLTSTGVTMRVSDKLYWASGSQLGISFFTGSTVGAPWYIGYNDWYNPSTLTGAFYLSGRMYYTKPGSNTLFYRYFEPDGYIVGASEFTLPTTGVTWSTVRGLAYADGSVLFGGTDGALRAAPFDPAAPVAVDGASAVLLAAATPELTWSSPTLFFSNQ